MLKRFYAMNLSPEARARLEAAVPAVVFVLSLGLFGAAALWRAQDIRGDAEVEIQHASERLASEVVRRLRQPIYGLNGARGVFAHDDKLNRAEFRAYVESRDLPKEFPGVRGFGFIQRVAQPELNTFVAAQRADGAPEFTPHPPPAQDQDDLYIVRFIEPAANNTGALGLVNADPQRRSAMQRAIDSGEPTMSEPITLQQDQRHTPGALLLVPVYRQGRHASNTAERRAALLGLLAAPVVMEELLRGLPEVASGLFDIEVFDSTASDAPASLIYDSDQHRAKLDGPTAAPAIHRYSALKTLSLMGRELSVRINAEPKFNAAQDQITPWLLFGAGGLISALLWLYLRRRWQQHSLVLDMVQQRTRELNQKRRRLRTILETATDGIHILDADGLLVEANPAFLKLLGLDESAIGRLRVSDWDANLEASAIREVIASLINAESSSVFESQSRHSDGHLIDVEVSARGLVIDGQSLVYCSSRDITERKRSETALREKERDLRTLIDNMPSLISYWDKNLCCRFGNAAYLSWFGVDASQMPGKHIREVIGEALYQLSLPYLEAVLRGEKQRFERAIPTPDGAAEHYSLVEYLPDMVDGQVQGFYAMVSDISDIKHAADALRQSEAKLRGLFELSPLGIAMVDMSGRFVEFNPAFQKICAYSEAELKAIDYWKLTPEKYMAGEAQQMEQLLATGRFGPYEKEYIRKDGSLVPISLNGIQITDHNGQQFIWSIIEDITERKQTMERLELFYRCIASTNDVIMITEAEPIDLPGNRIVFVNDAFERTTGYTREEAIGNTPRMLQGPKSDRATLDRIRQALSLWQPIHVEVLNYTKSGEEFWNELTIVPIANATGWYTHWISIQRDITERKRVNEQLVSARDAAEAANIAKSRFLAAMSHEVRTPMNGILGMAQVLLMPGVKEAERLDYSRTILTSGQTLLKLLNDILDLAKIEAGKIEIESIALVPAQILKQAQALFAPGAQAKGLQIASEWSGPPAHYLGDPHRLSQMLANLVGNAIKFSTSGNIHIEAHEVSCTNDMATLEFSVSDSGIGIAPDKLGLLFQAFSQVDSSTSRHFGGTGLGLSLVRTLAHLMGGEVGVQSELGQGSRFWFRICAKRLAVSADQESASQPFAAVAAVTDASTAPFMRVLLVEDNADHRRLTALLLKQLGAEVALAENGQQGLDAIVHGEAAQIILMDLHLPVLDGYAATAQIRAWEQRSRQGRRAIIALTADAFENDRAHCLAVGMDEVLTKPVSLQTLKTTLERWLPVAPSGTPAVVYQAIDAARVRSLIEEIEPLLLNHQFDAITRFRDLQEAVAGTELAAPITQAGQALHEFRFAVTLEQLRNIMAAQGWQGSSHE